MTLTELLRKYANGGGVGIAREEVNILTTHEQGELFPETKRAAIFQKILSVFPGARVVETREITKDSTNDANLDSQF